MTPTPTPLTPAWPAGRGLPDAGHLPRLSLPNLLLGVGLGVALAATLWWSGHPAAAAVILLGSTVALSAGCQQAVEETWVGPDWIANRFCGRPVVVDAADVHTIELPAAGLGLNYVIFRTERRTGRVDIGEALRRPTLARAVVSLADRAHHHGAFTTPDAAAVLDALARRAA